MKVINLNSLPEERKITCPKGNFTSNRFLLKEDGMGYTITKTIIPKGTKAIWNYKNHLESCYCVKGSGTVKNLEVNPLVTYEISPDSIYVLNNFEKHEFEALEETHLICVFNPPLNGTEVHNKEGIYEL
jgi:L-ectoine synthase